MPNFLLIVTPVDFLGRYMIDYLNGIVLLSGAVKLMVDLK